MKPEIIPEKQFILIGMSFYGDPFDTHTGWDEDNQIGLLWKRFMGYLAQNTVALQNAYSDKYCFEIHIYNKETSSKGVFEVFVGVEGDPARIAEIPVELSVKVLPRTSYAVFTFQGQQIVSDWEKVLEGWLDTSGYESPYSYNFQCYDERFKGLDNLEESTLEVFVPIKKAA
ncbi:MAG: GyrI-like domain-containing protein [Anaerolineaceae bacterium]